MLAPASQSELLADAGTDENPAKKAVRINVILSEYHYEQLKQVTAQTGMDMSEFVRTAIRMLAFLEAEKRKGNSVYVGQNNRAEKEIILP